MIEYKNEKIKFKLDDGILYTLCFPETTMELKDGIDSTRISLKMVNEVPLPLLCDLSEVTKMTIECRKHFSGKEHAKSFSKAALLVSSPISRIIGIFFMGLNKPMKPTILFTDKSKAIKWLKSGND
jgi:hypothetical protein